MTEIFKDGFESGDYTAWTGSGSNGTHQAISSDKHHGAYCDRCLPTAAWQDWSADVYEDVGNYDEIHSRNYVKFVSLPSGGKYFEINDFRVAWAPLGTLRIRNNGGIMQIGISSSEGGITYANYPFVTGQWYCIEFARYKNASVGWYKVYVDDSLAHSQTGLDTSAHYATRIFLGITYSGSAGTEIELYQDCCVIADTYIGPEVAVEEKPLICESLVNPLIVSVPVIRQFKLFSKRFPKFIPRVIV